MYGGCDLSYEHLTHLRRSATGMSNIAELSMGNKLDKITFGPMRLLVIVFDNPDFHGQIRREIESLMEKRIIRLIDLLFVWKDEDGNIKSMEAAQLDEEEKMRF